MRLFLLAFYFCIIATSQTQVYLPSGAPQAIGVCGVTVGPPSVITTCAPGTTTPSIAHGFSATCGVSATCYVVIAQVCDASNLPSAVNGLREITVINATQFSISTVLPSVVPITAGGTFVSCGGEQPWVRLITPYTLQAGPIGYLDGLNGPNYRKLALSTNNGLSSIVVSGCPGACVVTVTTSYPHGMLPTSAQGQTEYFAIWNSTSSALNTAGTGVVGTPYTVASTTTTTVTSTVVSGLTNGTFTTNNTCGSNGVTYDLINGTENCVVFTQLGYNTNPYWGSYSLQSGVTGWAYRLGIAQGGATPGIYYRHPFDGGGYTSGGGFWNDFSTTGINFLVDKKNQNLLSAIVYTLDYLYRGRGVNFSTVTDLDVGYEDSEAESSEFAIEFQIHAAWEFLSPTEQANLLNMVYGNINDPLGSPASTANTNLGNLSSVANTTVVTGTAQGGSSTSLTISAGDSEPDGYYTNLVAGFLPTGSTIWCSGQITNYVSSTKAATIAGGFYQRGDNYNSYAVCGSNPASGNSYKILAVASTSAWNGSPTGLFADDGFAVAGNSTSFTAAGDGDTISSVTHCFLPASYQYAACSCNQGSQICTISSGSFSPAPGNGTAYALYNGDPTSTITGVHTHFSSYNQGDGIYISNNAEENTNIPTEYGMVLNCASDTSCLVLNNLNRNGYLGYGGTPPMLVWRFPKNNPSTDTGWSWLANGVGEDPGSTPVLAPPSGGAGSDGRETNGPIGWSDPQRCSLGLAISSYTPDARAVLDVATYCTHGIDFQVAGFEGYETGPGHDGPHYTWEVQQPNHKNMAMILSSSIPTFPSLDLQGPWQYEPDIYKMFVNLPDLAYNGIWAPAIQGSGPPPTDCGNYPPQFGFSSGGSITFNPNSTLAAYYRNFITTQWPSGSSCLGNWIWGSQFPPSPSWVLQNQPIVGSSDFTVQPPQHLFQNTSNTACLTWGWPCPINYRSSLVISRSGFWSNANSTHGSRHDTHVVLSARTFCAKCFGPSISGIYDFWEAGHWQVYQVGSLIGSDYSPTDSGNFGGGGLDYTTIGMSPQIGGNDANITGDNQTPISIWACGNRGSWDCEYGDQSAQYMWVCANLAGAYTVAQNYNLGCMVEFKGTGVDHFLLHWTTIGLPSGSTITEHVHFTQNGEKGAYNVPPNPTIQLPYNEGDTTCPGVGGCNALDTNGRMVQELESGISDGQGTDPTPNYGLIATWMSPGNIFTQWLCPGGLECTSSPVLSTYPGGNGHTNPVAICAGSGSCNSSATVFEDLTVMKFAGNLTDTSLSTTALATNADFYYIQMNGATSSAVAVVPRQGLTYSSMASFTSTHTGTAPYLLAGLSPGMYAVTKNGSSVSGSPFTVAANDGSIYFTSTAGTIVVIPLGAAPSALDGSGKLQGGVVIH